MISTGLMDYLRSVADGFLPDLAAIARYTETSTSDGVEQVWALIAEDVPCRVSSTGTAGVERIGEGVARSSSLWTIWTAFETDVTERDRITVTGSDRVDGRTFEVQKVLEKTYEAQRAVECVLLG